MILRKRTFPREVLSFSYFQRRFSRVAAQRLFRQPICPTRRVLFGARGESERRVVVPTGVGKSGEQKVRRSGSAAVRAGAWKSGEQKVRRSGSAAVRAGDRWSPLQAKGRAKSKRSDGRGVPPLERAPMVAPTGCFRHNRGADFCAGLARESLVMLSTDGRQHLSVDKRRCLAYNASC